MNVDIFFVLSILATIIISMVVHEIMHAYTSYWLGDDTAKNEGRLSLNPLKHLDPFLSVLLPLMLAIVGAPIFGGAKPVPYNPKNVRGGDWGAALVALVGPLANLFLAFIAFGVMIFVGGVNTVSQFASYFLYVNLGFFIFNMLPIPPLDGSRVLYALAPDFVRQGMEYMERFGLIIVMMLVIFAGDWLNRLFITGESNIIKFFELLFGA